MSMLSSSKSCFRISFKIYGSVRVSTYAFYFKEWSLQVEIEWNTLFGLDSLAYYNLFQYFHLFLKKREYQCHSDLIIWS